MKLTKNKEKKINSCWMDMPKKNKYNIKKIDSYFIYLFFFIFIILNKSLIF